MNMSKLEGKEIGKAESRAINISGLKFFFQSINNYDLLILPIEVIIIQSKKDKIK